MSGQPLFLDLGLLRSAAAGQAVGMYEIGESVFGVRVKLNTSKHLLTMDHIWSDHDDFKEVQQQSTLATTTTTTSRSSL
ncbi:uncharacterized protein BO95DRAFT_188681 [Aspergillus brunneoviolaceus CBS 621.78]|uniref:Uncharacterized protein n=1 Tax=Aspergillus brunneoviolaceus CBS 621.78 TaxID=1450534 RepID=A0ACD1G495_9EURO|nr:hypothetical protein BO95DRAFT_188681 [Aspergillus brunneoviolaceus CBS 621.78]RAH43984.1 hypothetical protein BO95DRAFT_188681 [Aspergillus brunneoviolaceus CBS 621.78]